MHYSDWQVDLIRNQVRRFWLWGGQEGSTLSLAKVHARLIACGATALTDRHGKVMYRYEALRRFLAEETKPDDYVLENIVKFLVHERWISAEKLEEKDGIRREMISITDYLANTDAKSKKLLADLSQELMSTRRDGGRQIDIRISTRLNPDGTSFVVDENVQRLSSPGNRALTQWKDKSDGAVTTETRRGYGFVATPANLIYIICKGATPDDTVIYVQAHLQTSLRGAFFLLRTGEGVGTGGEHRLTDNDSVQIRYGFRFQNANSDLKEVDA